MLGYSGETGLKDSQTPSSLLSYMLAKHAKTLNFLVLTLRQIKLSINITLEGLVKKS